MNGTMTQMQLYYMIDKAATWPICNTWGSTTRHEDAVVPSRVVPVVVIRVQSKSEEHRTLERLAFMEGDRCKLVWHGGDNAWAFNETIVN